MAQNVCCVCVRKMFLLLPLHSGLRCNFFLAVYTCRSYLYSVAQPTRLSPSPAQPSPRDCRPRTRSPTHATAAHPRIRSPSPRDCRPAHATSCTPRRITSQLCAMVFFTPGVQHPEVDVSKRYPGFPIPVSPTPKSTGHHVVHLARSVRVCTWPRNLPHLTLGSCDSINSSTSEFFIGSGGKYGCGWVRMSKYPGVV